jgi:predicted PurR-regulated permease PerM
MRIFWQRNSRYIWFAAITAITLFVVYHYILFLLPFLIGMGLVYLFMPFIRWLERSLPPRYRWMEGKRIIAILIVFLVIIFLLVLFIYLAAITIAHNAGELVQNASSFINGAFTQLKNLTAFIRNQFPETMRAQVDEVMNNLASSIGGSISNAFAGGGSLVSGLTGSIGIIFSFAALPVFLFYLLKDEERIKTGLYASLSPAAARRTHDILTIIENSLGRYLRGTLILGAVVSGLTYIGLLIAGAPFAIPLALINGLFEMIPTIGPIVGGIVMGVVTLAMTPDRVVWVLLVAVLVQLLENNLLVPRIQGATLQMNPALIIFLLVMGGHLFGFWGVALSVPVTSTLIAIFKYLRRMDQTEPGQAA